jgi:hypothetical protein
MVYMIVRRHNTTAYKQTCGDLVIGNGLLANLYFSI